MKQIYIALLVCAFYSAQLFGSEFTITSNTTEAELNKHIVDNDIEYSPAKIFYLEGSNNIVVINDKAKKQKDKFQYLFGGYSKSANAIRNKVTMYDGEIQKALTGGAVAGLGRGANSRADYNEVIVENGTIKADLMGGLDKTDGGVPGTTANNNKVVVNGGNIEGRIFGGNTYTGSAQYNIVTINGGNINKDNIIAGGAIDQGAAGSKVTYNTVNLNVSNITLGKIAGAATDKGGSSVSKTKNIDMFTGNTLNIRGKNITAKAIFNFEYINFYIPKDIMRGDNILKLTDDKDALDLTKTKISVSTQGNLENLKQGDEINLIKSALEIKFPNSKFTAFASLSTDYEFSIYKSSDKKSLLAKVYKTSSSARNKNAVETTAGAVSIINQSSDNLASIDIASSSDAMGMFSGVSGGATRLNSGSYIDTTSASVVIGAAKDIQTYKFPLTLGAFVEFGGGKYDSFNDFSGGVVKGTGNIKYFGLGATSKVELKNQFYADLSLKLGGINSDYKNKDYSQVKYDITRFYFGTTLGAGKIININDKSNLDLYLGTALNRIASKDINIAKENVRLYGSNSILAKFKAKYNYKLNEKYILFAALGVEQELDGIVKARNLTHNTDIKSPSMKGNTRSIEFGANINNFHNFDINAKLKALNGKKEGLNLALEATYKF